MDIKEELKKTMEWLAEQPDSIFVGQYIVYPENKSAPIRMRENKQNKIDNLFTKIFGD